MNRLMNRLLCIGLLLGAALPAMAGHRDHDRNGVSVIFHTPFTDVHYRNVSPYRASHGHNHGHNCGHHWNGRYWGKPVPYYQGHRERDGHHGRSHYNGYKNDHHGRSHRAKGHHRDRHNRYDGGHGRGETKHRRGDNWGDDNHRGGKDRDRHDKGRRDKDRRHGD